MNVFTRARHNAEALSEGLKIIRRVISSPEFPSKGVSTAQLYALTLQDQPSPTYEGLEAHEYAWSPPPARLSKMKTSLPFPPHPKHPIRSMSFLKRRILPILEGNHELKISPEKVKDAVLEGVASENVKNPHRDNQNRIWTWKPIPEHLRPDVPKIATQTAPFGADVGVGEDWSHLSKRRQRAREKKVSNAVKKMKKVTSG